MRAMLLVGLAVGGTACALAARPAPDDIELMDGKKLSGLIVKRTGKFVVLQTGREEVTIPNDYIRRVNDLPDEKVYFAEVTRPGDLPDWRSIVLDLRLDDTVRSFQQIPATAIDVGNLRNVPYLSFRINEASEMNVYGNPDAPAAVEFGIYGRARGKVKRREMIREFFAGHLHSREEIRSLYSLDMEKGGKVRCGKLVFEVTPPEAEDSYGGRWIVIYDPVRLEKARVSNEAYAKVTKPFGEVNRRDGRLRKDLDAENEGWLEETLHALTGKEPDVRGFYRDKSGVFRVMKFDRGS